jgi:ABC-type Fe3+ transport system permease subunit
MGPAVRTAIFSSAAMTVSVFALDETFGLNTVYAQIVRLSGYGDMVTSCTMGSALIIICYILFLLGIGHIREGETDA